MADLSGPNLEAGKLDIEARMRTQQIPGRSPHYEELFTSKVAKFVFGILRQLGLSFPFQFIYPPPWAIPFTREGVIQVPPGGTYDLTFRAPRSGYTVLECEVWPMCPLACEYLQIEHWFGSSKNSPDHSLHPGQEAGIWKFRRIFLAHGRAYTTRLINPDPYAHLVVGFEYFGWEL